METAAGSLTYAQLDAEADVTARRLSALGVGEGDRVATTLAPGLDFAVLLHAAPHRRGARPAQHPPARGRAAPPGAAAGADPVIDSALDGFEADVSRRATS